MRMALPSLLLVILTGCSGAELHSGATAGTAVGSSDGSNGNSPGSTVTTYGAAPAGDPENGANPPNTTTQGTTTGSPALGDPDTASPPVAVGGASLTCNLGASGNYQATCFAVKDGKPLDFPVAHAYYHLDKKGWVSTEFKMADETTLGKYLVKLPADEIKDQSVAIALANAKNETLADWIVDVQNPPALAIKDGSFENHRIDYTTPSSIDATHFLEAGDQTGWKASSTKKDSNGVACSATIELTSNRLDTNVAEAKDGAQFTELDSICHSNEPMHSVGDNILLYQDLTLVKDHYYEVSFSYRHRVNTSPTPEQGFKMAFDGIDRLSVAVTADTWTTVKFVTKATKAQTRISFQETGDDSDGVGTYLDDVKVIEIGDLPAP